MILGVKIFWNIVFGEFHGNVVKIYLKYLVSNGRATCLPLDSSVTRKILGNARNYDSEASITSIGDITFVGM